MDIQRLQKRLREFITARDLEQFHHGPKALVGVTDRLGGGRFDCV